MSTHGQRLCFPKDHDGTLFPQHKSPCRRTSAPSGYNWEDCWLVQHPIQKRPPLSAGQVSYSITSPRAIQPHTMMCCLPSAAGSLCLTPRQLCSKRQARKVTPNFATFAWITTYPIRKLELAKSLYFFCLVFSQLLERKCPYFSLIWQEFSLPNPKHLEQRRIH